MSERKVKLDIQDGVAVITLNDPSALNAVSPPMLEALADALTDIEAPDSGVRCVIMTGEGRGFSAGANLQGRGEQDPNRKPNARLRRKCLENLDAGDNYRGGLLSSARKCPLFRLRTSL